MFKLPGLLDSGTVVKLLARYIAQGIVDTETIVVVHEAAVLEYLFVTNRGGRNRTGPCQICQLLRQ